MVNKKRTGAQSLIDCLEQQGVEYIFGFPGGANIPIFDALIDSSLKLIRTRHEQGATHMADGYARACGKAGVVLVTSGPGATNTVTGIMTAFMDSVPMVVICGQTVIPSLGLDAFQEADVSGITFPITKHSYLIKKSEDIPRVVKEAFHIAETGRPGPVVIDIPKDISSLEFEPDYNVEINLPGYTVPAHGDSAVISQVAEELQKAKRPLLLLGHGALISDAGKAIRSLVDKMKIPVVNTLLGKGAFPESHPLCLGMLGMHGTAYANQAVIHCDLIMSIGSRWDDRIVGNQEEFCKNAVKIHVDIDPAEANKMITPEYFILGDARLVVEELNTVVQPGDTVEWVKQIAKWKKQLPLKYKKQGGLKVQYILEELCRITKGKAVVATDVGQNQMWSAQFCLVEARYNWLSSGGAGTMGFGFPAALGAQLARPNDQVWAVVGDGGFQMTFFELATAVIYKLPVKVIIMDNRFLGMVRQWQDLFYQNRLSGTPMPGNPDFVKLAEAFGAKGFRLKRNADVTKILTAALDYNDGPCLIHAEVEPKDNVFPMIPAGAVYETMMLEARK
ncbi:biosynthetic-type acetolactate synthase large subunit [Fibrobacterota bacterium]